jgi:hypothetical protein
MQPMRQSQPDRFRPRRDAGMGEPAAGAMKQKRGNSTYLMSAERAIKRLAKLAGHIDEKDLAEWMIQGDKVGACHAGDLWFVATWLDDIAQSGVREYEESKPCLKCVVCGNDSHRLEVRRHARYCSDKCRQRAYRQRNGLSKRTQGETVTNGRSVTVDATELQTKP